MTISRFWVTLMFLALGAGDAGAQSQPKDLPWAVSEFDGDSDWSARLPLLLVRTWDDLPDHRVTDAEKSLLKKEFLDGARRAVDAQVTQVKLSLDRKRLAGPLPTTEPEASRTALADLQAKIDQISAGNVVGSDPPETLALRGVWGTGTDHLPWKVLDHRDLEVKTSAKYLVTGRVREVDSYLAVDLQLYSAIENRVLAEWHGSFAPEEASERMSEASDRLREALLGRPWAALSITSPVSGARVRYQGSLHVLPWSSDTMVPGTLDLTVEYPGRPPVKEQPVLEPGKRVKLDLPDPGTSAEQLVLETDPPGAFLWVDSQYIGPSPQTIVRPFATTRVRAQSPGWETRTWEIGPDTPSPSKGVLAIPGPHPSLEETKDTFYFSLAAFSFSFTTTVFLGAWSNEQINLVNAYYTAGSTSGYNTAMNRFNLINNTYGVGIGLTSALAIWMIFFTLQDYLNAAQDSLP